MTMFNYTKLADSEVEFIEIAPSSDLPPNERLFIEVDQRPIVIFNIADQLFAIDDLCTHDDGLLGEGELEEFEIVCPRHGARFDIRSGEVKSMPAARDIPAYPVRINKGMIEIGLPKEG